MASSSKTFLDSALNRIFLFVFTFVFGLVLAWLDIGLQIGWQAKSVSWETMQFVAYLLAIIMVMAPLTILFFPAGLTAYLPSDNIVHWLLFAWAFYFVTSLLGIVVKQRLFGMLMYTMFLIVLILNIAGCGPVTLDALSGLD